MRRWLGGLEERIVDPHVTDVVKAEVRVLEQVRGLSVDPERVLLGEVFLVSEVGGSVVWAGPGSG
ncbi:hypothetical protein [Nostocoides sp. F2B08]|uniref:hypothetical protein n=1 Tax=Nostocoides sp. F2B08 TaxID=2653936 RepID=UPI00186B1EA0|nr:hypothetical protein [Tetrasphaera sp. F2B08]